MNFPPNYQKQQQSYFFNGKETILQYNKKA